VTEIEREKECCREKFRASSRKLPKESEGCRLTWRKRKLAGSMAALPLGSPRTRTETPPVAPLALSMCKCSTSDAPPSSAW
jgi:hypothetical protein